MMRDVPLTEVATALARARRSNGVFLQITPTRAAADAERASGPLAGVPYAVKDVFDVRGTRTSAASQLFDRRSHAVEDAEVVRRLCAAGAVVVGKTTMSELAFSGLGVNRRFGTPTLERGGRRYVVGGSSSGSAAAVKQGIVPFALASDTSGSARIPAAWTGLFGFRPSRGRYPSAGMTPLAPTLDTVGIIAARLETLEVVDTVLANDRHINDESVTASFVAPDDDFLSGCDPHIVERFHHALGRLRANGHSVVHRRISALHTDRELHDLHIPVVESEAYAAFGHLPGESLMLSAPVRRRLERTRNRLRHASSAPLLQAMMPLRSRFRDELGEKLLLTPPSQIDPPAYEEVAGSLDLHDERNASALKITMLLAYLDAPSLIVPLDGDDDLSGIQISAPAGHDRRVLDAARQLLLTSTRLPAMAFKGER